jgi:hypothetical protein
VRLLSKNAKDIVTAVSTRKAATLVEVIGVMGRNRTEAHGIGIGEEEAWPEDKYSAHMFREREWLAKNHIMGLNHKVVKLSDIDSR